MLGVFCLVLLATGRLFRLIVNKQSVHMLQLIAYQCVNKEEELCLLRALFCLPSKDLSDYVSIKNQTKQSARSCFIDWIGLFRLKAYHSEGCGTSE